MNNTSLTSEQNAKCAAAQDLELEALESIYQAPMFKRDNFGTHLSGATIIIHTELPKLNIHVNISLPSSLGIEPETFQVEHLPPLQFDVVFPKDYPDYDKPRYILKCHWLSPGDLSRVCAKLDELWELNDGMSIVFIWVDFLEKELLTFLGMIEELNVLKLLMFQHRMGHPNISHKVWRPEFPGKERGRSRFDVRARTIYIPPKSFAAFIKEANQSRKRELFNKSYVTCSICYSCVCGKDMTMFKPCEHAFCNNCTQAQFCIQIRDGCPNGLLTCMEPSCTSEALSIDVKKLVGEDLFEKYDQLLLNRYLKSRADIISCPRELCEKPVIIEPDSAMATCSTCNLSFCLTCRRPSHGINPCETGNASQLAMKYLNATPEVRAALEKKFSKKYLTAIVNEYDSQNWIKENAKKCPRCQTIIQKSEGCNKMQCWKCSTRFCYLCGKSLEHLADPYLHFSDELNECNNRLFEECRIDKPGEQHMLKTYQRMKPVVCYERKAVRDA
ncbi:E3 ubiquitin-protein ligase RNF14-like isoform X1 [Varroa destructor]|uniref:RBR-type E3 ubiquitin transferase n=1 Tax=Varroa destructor TaxID=109461 RepID=A0A7M7M3L6_VARDE|nr:E3 ubiquitin-protein ligase RNF14-like isoform X1 [Varroa destructor]XP_022645801.1 E3 ubiquitin-protein ligase RNF14-like isoform X1 [Varroa destructor]XP_022645802.1 E3 ubiquitin-protein ligase RNF14-like isoform X1 [Varroa destructor]XP_022645803.1 E3 ubiquitin-protein ligase RNF14-like isoform X1 [Varroa destructor]XP_022645804.1 E3 ubiquitin-protein ligase RNF14-like isoform X1 [Varroa destructor]XP_022645805.1 E3 ubiquitin-protein ligase RNF14-like isoform X1 [Varroa destructor]